MAYLFVYGTLRPEFENEMANQLKVECTLLGKATVKGSIYDLGHYPAFVADTFGRVHGWVYRLNSVETLVWMDRYEDVPVLYLRNEVKAKMDGQKIVCNIYEYAGHVYKYNRVESGDYLEYSLVPKA
jgi:gamma-glutamylcyclotransferase (GGCT)/AIG2-like uncharacterized protein YtfP